MTLRTSLTLLTIVLMGSGCVTTQTQNPWPTDPLYDAPPPAADPEVDEWGKYRFTDTNVYRGNKPQRRGDHVVVHVAHSVRGAGSANTTTNRTSTAEAGISAMFGLEGAIPDIAGITPSASLSATDTNDYTGAGNTDRTGVLETVVTAKVLDVLANGYLVIGARQQVKINNEVDILWLYGVVDPRLIGSNNSIASQNVADLRMEYSGMGVIAGKQRPGWLTRVLDVIRPF
jgi:flagellar L-ring protein FlgH